MSNTSSNTSKVVLFLLPFGKGMGVGHVVRQSVLARELSARGYQTILWTAGAFEEIPAALVDEMKECFSQIIRPGSFISDSNNSKFPDEAAVEALKNLPEMQRLKDVIIDDYRLVNKPEQPARVATLQALKAFAHGKGARVIMVDGVNGLEFDQADIIWNMELGRDESLYKPEWKEKMVFGMHYALLRPAFLQPGALSDPLPSNPFLLMIGGTDPQNACESLLHGMAGTGYNPVLILNQSNKPEDAGRMQALRDALGKFPQSLWLGNQQAPQMSALFKGALFAIVGPGTSPCAEAFYHRCPVIGAWTNPSLEANVAALQALGLPTLHATNHEEIMAAWGNNTPNVQAHFAPSDVKAAVQKLETLDYIKNRLPNAAPFNEVDDKGAWRIADVLELYTLAGVS